MGLLSSAFAKGFVKGVGENIVDWQDEVKEKEDLYNENLTKAKRRVNEITTDLGKKYDDSVSLVNRYGGGAFGNYLVQNYSFDQLSEYNNLAPSIQEEQIRSIKSEFDKIKDKSAFTDADFTKTAKEKLDEQVQATRTSTISEIAGEAPVAPTGKIGQVLTGGIRAGAEAEREKIMGGFAEPVTTAEYAPIDRDFQATIANLYTLPKKNQYENIIFDDLYTYDSTTNRTEPRPEKQNIIDNTQEIVNDIANRGFGQYDVVQYLAEQNFANDNLDYKPVWQNYQGEFTPNSNYALNFVNQFEESLTAGTEEDLQTAREVIELFTGSGLAGNQDLAQKLQVQYDNYVKDMTDEEQVTKQETVTVDIPEGELIQKGKVKTFGASKYVSPEERLKNSQVDVTEDFIQQVMQKNNTSRQNAINILKDYGYKKFPEKKSVTSTVKGRIKGE